MFVNRQRAFWCMRLLRPDVPSLCSIGAKASRINNRPGGPYRPRAIPCVTTHAAAMSGFFRRTPDLRANHPNENWRPSSVLDKRRNLPTLSAIGECRPNGAQAFTFLAMDATSSKRFKTVWSRGSLTSRALDRDEGYRRSVRNRAGKRFARFQ